MLVVKCSNDNSSKCLFWPFSVKMFNNTNGGTKYFSLRLKYVKKRIKSCKQIKLLQSEAQKKRLKNLDLEKNGNNI